MAEIRKDHGDTQRSLAEKLNVVHFTVSSWEQGKSEPNHEMLVKICRLYHVSSDYLLGLSDVDPAYVRSKIDALCSEDQAFLKEVETFLRWRRSRTKPLR
ncbi:MAG: helix-turn-helix transcriptional regulator [Oscillospiraceae bacterium]|nr:helix-turn-helix transcriptional regulator [Oscillospiraceae bacterium]